MNMKKIAKKFGLISLILVFAVLLSSCSGVTSEQKSVCEEADRFLEDIFVETGSPITYNRSVKKIEGEVLYGVTLYASDSDDLKFLHKYAEFICESLIDIVKDEGIYVVLYIANSSGDTEYRAIDDRMPYKVQDKINKLKNFH